MIKWPFCLRIFSVFLLFHSTSLTADEPPVPAKSASLGSCSLESGEVIQPCNISYRLYGELNGDKSNVVLMPSWHNGTSADSAKYNYLGPGAMVDTNKYFVIAVDVFGGGVSSSPSNQGASPDPSFPQFSIRDMVHSQYRLLTEHLQLERLHAVVGASMGAYQAYEWMMLYPHYVDRFVPIEGAPWISYYDYVQRRAIGTVLSRPLQTEEDLHRGIAHLQAAEFLYEVRLFPDVEYTFKHGLTYQVAYGSLLHDRRRDLHAQIVEAIETLYSERIAEQVERLAHHAVCGEIWVKAVRYQSEAGTRAFARSAHQEASRYFEQALAILEAI